MRTITLLAVATAASGRSPVKVIKQSTPEKALILEVSIPAMRAEVWRAFTTSEGLSTWLTPGSFGRPAEGRRMDRALSGWENRRRYNHQLR